MHVCMFVCVPARAPYTAAAHLRCTTPISRARACRRVLLSCQIKELEETIEELETTVETQAAKMRELEEDANDECERLRVESDAIVRRCKEAEEETNLKRETSKKLKEEVIENDREDHHHANSNPTRRRGQGQ